MTHFHLHALHYPQLSTCFPKELDNAKKCEPYLNSRLVEDNPNRNAYAEL